VELKLNEIQQAKFSGKYANGSATRDPYRPEQVVALPLETKEKK
jgi:hypothetical protein